MLSAAELMVVAADGSSVIPDHNGRPYLTCCHKGIVE